MTVLFWPPCPLPARREVSCMVFRILLYIALATFIFGLVFKVSAWFSRTISLPPGYNTFFNRLAAFATDFIRTIFSFKLLKILKTILLDVGLQRKTFRDNKLRWIMHIMIYGGFVSLLLMRVIFESSVDKEVRSDPGMQGFIEALK